MPEFPPGTPSWTDLGSPDPEASVAFYGGLFGWEATEPGPVEQTGGYRNFTQDGANVAGLMQLMQEGQPPAWTTYVSVADADATAAAAAEHGGRALFEPMDVMDFGRMAILADPAGAVFGIWQAKSFAGADVVRVPNSMAWNEVLTNDVERAKSFYGAVFGWSAGPGLDDGPPSYVVWTLGEAWVGGGMALADMGEAMPAGVPPHWGVTFAVADADATAARAQELGGTVFVPVMEMSIGRFAMIRDPHGASFSIMQDTTQA